jgi:hypothetical protein
MPKKIVILCDGTNNYEDRDTYLTNMGRLDHILDKSENQVVIYEQGVGTESHSALVNWINDVTARDFAERISFAYKKLAENYQAGDEIYIFGFSRGAGTAVALASKIRNIGIIKDFNNEKVLQAAQSIYLQTPGVDDPASELFRTTHSYFDGVTINFLGLFDTVEQVKDAEKQNNYFDIVPNAILENDMIIVFRHALAIDEFRGLFSPTVFLEDASRDMEQRWFAGAHGDVGGMYKHHGLSDLTFKWMLQQVPALEFIDSSLWPQQAVRHDSPEPDSEATDEDADKKRPRDDVIHEQLAPNPNALAKRHNQATSDFIGKVEAFVGGLILRTVGFLPGPNGNQYIPSICTTIDDSVIARISDPKKRYVPQNLTPDVLNRLERKRIEMETARTAGAQDKGSKRDRDNDTNNEAPPRSRMRPGSPGTSLAT